MTRRPPHLTPEQRAELEAWENRALSPEEFEARVRAPWTADERDDFDGLVRWFNRRYPTPALRLAATRHLMAQLRMASDARIGQELHGGDRRGFH